jgi:hypothetical protein
MNTIPNQLIIGAATLITSIPLVLIILILFRTCRRSFKTSRGIGAGILLASMVLLAYCLSVGLSLYFFTGLVAGYPFLVKLTAYCAAVAVYGAIGSFFLFGGVVAVLLVLQGVAWTGRRSKPGGT